jgi:hypothetical protein
VVFQLLTESVSQPGEAARCHTKRQIAALDVACADFGRHAPDGFTRYSYYLSRRIAVRRTLAKVRYRYRLHDDAMSAVAEGVTDRRLVGMVAVSADLRGTQDTLAKVLHEVVRGLRSALAGAIGDDGAACEASATNVY